MATLKTETDWTKTDPLDTKLARATGLGKYIMMLVAYFGMLNRKIYRKYKKNSVPEQLRLKED